MKKKTVKDLVLEVGYSEEIAEVVDAWVKLGWLGSSFAFDFASLLGGKKEEWEKDFLNDFFRDMPILVMDGLDPNEDLSKGKLKMSDYERGFREATKQIEGWYGLFLRLKYKYLKNKDERKG